MKKFKNKTEKKKHLKSLIENDGSDPQSYKMANSYLVGDYITHPKFGEGFVENLLGLDKIKVFFEGSERILLHNR